MATEKDASYEKKESKAFLAGYYIEEIILILIIILGILDFLEALGPDLDYILKIISWTCMAYLLYSLSLTKLFFGERKKIYDIILIMIFFLLIFKDFIGFTLVAYDEIRELALNQGYVSMVYPLVELIRDPVNNGYNASLIEYLSFTIGGILLLLFSLITTFTIKIHHPSVLHVLHEDEPRKKTIFTESKKFFVIFFVLTAFFVIIFNLIMEWLAMSVDSSLLVFTIIFYLFTAFRRHHKHFSPTSVIYKIGDSSEMFYEKVISLFHDKGTFFLGISGILVLHLLTDLGIFLIPYITGIEKVFYFSQMNTNHTALFAIFMQDLSSISIMQAIPLALLYILNILAMLYLLAMPAIIWYKLFTKQPFRISSLNLSLFICSIFIFFICPAFKIAKITGSNLIGVDITTHSILNDYTYLIALSVLVIFMMAYLLSKIHKAKEDMLIFSIIAVDIFFTYYIFMYATSIIGFYLSSIPHLFSLNYIVILIYFILFLIISSLFYIAGFISFILETKKEYSYMR